MMCSFIRCFTAHTYKVWPYKDLDLRSLVLLDSCTCIFQEWLKHMMSNILTSVDSDESVQPPFMLRNSK